MPYHDSDGNPISLRELVDIEPEWAVNRLKIMREEILELLDFVDRVKNGLPASHLQVDAENLAYKYNKRYKHARIHTRTDN